MCTVTVIPLEAPERGVRLACNRDELLTRPLARPPQRRVAGMRQCLLPVDPTSDGTWIGVNDAGIAVALLNVNLPGSARSMGRQSRGAIVPRLLQCESFDAAVAAAVALDPRHYPPFCVVIVDARNIASIRSDGEALVHRRDAIGEQPWFFTSSGLGDDLVDAPRRALFHDMLMNAARGAADQDRFHRHRWPDRPHLSVCMERADARTVSYTVVELLSDRAVLWYSPDAPDRAAPLAPLTLARSGGPAW